MCKVILSTKYYVLQQLHQVPSHDREEEKNKQAYLLYMKRRISA